MKDNVIPHKIYYIWVGKNPLNKDQKKCISSWKHFFPGYEIIEINETNFDINSSCKLCSLAYKDKWYQYVSDYVRLKIIYENGGIYFDTDVEVIKDFRDLIEKGPYFGFSREEGRSLINTGLGFACTKGHPLLKRLIDLYESWDGDSFTNSRGFHAIQACPLFNEPVFNSWGVIPNNEYQLVNGVSFFPSSFFESFDVNTRKEDITEESRTIHHYTGYSAPKIDRWFSLYCVRLNNKYGRILEYAEVRKKMIIFHPLKYICYHHRHKEKKK